MKVVKIILSFTLLLSTNAFAAWTPASTVLAIRAYPSGEGHYVKISSSFVNEGCAGTVGKGVYFLSDGNGRVVSMLMAAQVSNQKVRLSIVGCGGGPYGNIVEVQLGEIVWNEMVD